MQVFGNIATPVEKKSAKSGKDFYTFRLAENQGRDEHRTTTWYDVTAFISELDADLLAKGQFIRVEGRLDVQAFKRKNGEPGASATILAFKITPVERTNPAPQNAGTPNAGAAPRPAPAPDQHAPSSFDDMDDDIPF